jgi:hypothetical protein
MLAINPSYVGYELTYVGYELTYVGYEFTYVGYMNSGADDPSGTSTSG